MLSFCKCCKENKNNKKGIVADDLTSYGYTVGDSDSCIFCGNKDLIKYDMTDEDALDIATISRSVYFLEEMLDLYLNNVEEYEKRMAEYRIKAPEKRIERSKPSCPYCGSKSFFPKPKKSLFSSPDDIWYQCSSCKFRWKHNSLSEYITRRWNGHLF